MILFIGQVERFARGQGRQEVDYPAMFGGEAKWVAEITDASRVNEFVSRAFTLASTGAPAQSCCPCPRTCSRSAFARALSRRRRRGNRAVRERYARIVERLIAAASRPVLILGGTLGQGRRLATLCAPSPSIWSIPVATSYRRLPLFDAVDARYAGDLGLNANPALIKLVQDSDLLLLVGGRLGEIPFPILSPARYSRAANDLRSCLSTGGRTRPRLCAQIRNSRFAARLRACAARFASAETHSLARRTTLAHGSSLGFSSRCAPSRMSISRASCFG